MDPDIQPQTPIEEPQDEPMTAQPVQDTTEQSFNEDTFSEPNMQSPVSGNASGMTSADSQIPPMSTTPSIDANPLPPDQNVVTPTTPNPEPAPAVLASLSVKKTNIWLWISLSIVVVLVAGVFIYIYMLG